MPQLASSSARRVLVTTDAVGGVWRYSVDLARQLRAQGRDCVLAVFGPPPDARQRAEARQVAELRRVGLPLDWMVTDRRELADVPETIDRLADETRADVVQLNLPSQAAGLRTAARVVTVSHSCIVSWFRAVRDEDPPAHMGWHRALCTEGMARADRVIAPSHSHAGLIARCYPGLGPLEVVPNGAAPPPGPSGSKLAFIHAAGRWWDEGKGGATLDAAAALVDWPVVAVGPLSQGGGQAFRFRHARPRGARPHVQVRQAASVAGIFVSTSVYEPFGLAALESAAAGAALVLSDIPTYRELWDEAALFAPPGDPQAFAEQINRLTGDPALRRRLGARARARATRYSLAAQGTAMRRILDGLAEPAKEVS